MAIKTWLGTDVGNEGNWATVANWLPSGVPVTGDIILFDGAISTQAVTASPDQTGVNALAIISLESYTGNICDNDAGGAGIGPLIIECSKVINIQGTGNTYIQCGNDLNDADVKMIICDSEGTIGLSSQKNAVAGNVGIFELIHILRGTVKLYGSADIANTGAQSGTAFGRIVCDKLQSRRQSTVLTIGDLCSDIKNTVDGQMTLLKGAVESYTEIPDVLTYDGTYKKIA